MPLDHFDHSLADAERALRARQESPAQALAEAESVLARTGISDGARLVALWAMGLAERELNLLAEAEDHLRMALAIAEHIQDDARRAQVTSALVAVVTSRGRAEEALAIADEISGLRGPSERADLDMKRAMALEQLGRLDEALDAYTRALGVIASGDDRVLEARLRTNRAIVLVYRGDIDRALADLEIAERLAVDHGQFFLAGGAAHNHGFSAGRRGDIVTALASFDRAERLYATAGSPGRCRGVLAADRCEVMMVAGLHDEARAAAELAVHTLEGVDDVTDLAEARLLLARACLAQGDRDAARAAASDALAAFRTAGRAGWATMAEYLVVSARPVDPDRQLIELAGDLAGRLHALGWGAEAVDVHVSTAEMALTVGEHETARTHLGLAARARRHGSPDRRANAWLATALLRRADGNRLGARRAIASGLTLIAEHQATLGATDLRVGSTVHARRLLDVGLGLAIESRRPRDVLTWAEWVRANALTVPAARPSGDERLARELAELRRLRAELDDCRRQLLDPTAATAEVQRQEAIVRDLARFQPGGSARAAAFSVDRLQDRLGDARQLVEYVEHGGVLSAIVVTQRRCRQVQLVEVGDVAEILDATFFALDRLARDGTSENSLAAAYSSLVDTLARLDDLLIRPLRVGRTPLVVVPTGALHRVPWGALRSLATCAVAVTPSARRWASVEARPHDRRSLAVVTGPGLRAVDDEALAVGSHYPVTRLLSGSTATVAATLDLLDVSDTAHIACHGSFRSDSPMFSSLTLADGPLTVYDLERLTTPPSVVILPACHAGRSVVGVGDELIGTATALLGIGVHTVVAPITVVNDRATVGVMAVLHRHLSAGAEPAAALAMTRTEVTGGDDLAASAAAVALICLE